LLGRNGVANDLKSIMGMVGRRQGSIAYAGKETIGLPSNALRAWDRLLPCGARIFAS